MLRQSAVNVFRSKFNTALSDQDPGWFQPPWVKGEIQQNERRDFVKKNSAWYLQHQQVWLDQYQKYNEHISNSTSPYIPQQLSKDSRMFQLGKGSFESSLIKQSQRPQQLTNISRNLGVKQQQQPQPVENQPRHSSTSLANFSQDRESPKFILDQAKDYLIKQQRESSASDLFWSSKFFGEHQLKICTVAFLFVSTLLIIISAIGWSINYVSIKSATFMILFVLVQICGHITLQKQKSLQFNLLIIGVSVWVQQYLSSFLIQAFMHNQRMTQIQYYMLSSYSIWQTINNIFKRVQVNPPLVNKMFQFNQSFIKIIIYSLRVKLSNYRSLKLCMKSFLISLLFGSLTYFILSFEKIKSIDASSQIQYIVVIIFIYHTFVLVLESMVIKLRKYYTIQTLYNCHQLIPLYIFPFITKDSNLEIESLKFIYNEIEQSKKLFYTEKMAFRNLGNKNTGNQLKQLLYAYMHETLSREVDGIIAMINQEQKYRNEKNRLQQISIFQDITCYWDQRLIINEINNLMKQIIQRIKFLNFFSEVYFRLLNTNPCELGEADLQQKINDTISRYVLYLFNYIKAQFLQSTHQLGNIKVYYQLRKGIFYIEIFSSLLLRSSIIIKNKE